MNYPKNLEKGDTIGICAPSLGIIAPDKLRRLDAAIKQLKQMGYDVIETSSVRKMERGRSATAEQRAKEFMELWENESVKLIIFAAGGDFLCEMLTYLDWKKLKTLPPKWVQGYSNITDLTFLMNSILEIPSMHCQNIKDYAMKPLHRSLIDALAIESGEEVVQESFEKYEKNWKEETDPCATYHLTEKVRWRNLIGGDRIVIQGRTLGGNLDSLINFFGTKYDKINDYIDKHKEEGIIWFLECYEMSTAIVYRILWQMKQASYFRYCNGIIFGRSLLMREDYGITFSETIKDALGDLNIPIICDADIGHVSPQMAIVNGAILKITSEKGKGTVETFLR